MLGENQTWDEGIHLAAGYGYLTTGDYSFNPEHPALGKILAALPLLPLRLEYKQSWSDAKEQTAGLEFLYANRAAPELMLGLGRSVSVALTLLFAGWLAWWTRARFGVRAALIALALFCFDPNIIAHGRYVTTDLIASLFIFLAATLWLDYLAAPSRARLALAGLALGGALASKYSALFLVPLVIGSGLLAKRWRETSVAVLIAIGVVGLVYFPEVLAVKSRDRLIGHLTGTGSLGHALVWAARKYNLHTWTYLIGLDRLSEHNTVGHPSYLLGEFSDHGWWYYFPVAFAVKTPLATLIATVLSAALIWRTKASRFHVAGLAVVAVVFAGFCLSSRINIGYRHLLPLLPFLFVLAGAALSRHVRLATVLVIALAAESFAVYPFYLSFFNVAAGGPANGHKYLLDSNLDWGQDLKRLGGYLRQRQIPLVCLHYFGNVDWGRYGVNFVDFPQARAEDCDNWAVVSATPLFGLYVPYDYFAGLRRLTPADRIGYSIYIFDLRKRK